MDINLKEYIRTMDEFSNSEINEVCLDILNRTNAIEQKELLEIFLDRTIEYFKYNNTYSETEILEKLYNIINMFSAINNTNEILKDKEFTIENVLNKIKTSQISDKKNSPNDIIQLTSDEDIEFKDDIIINEKDVIINQNFDIDNNIINYDNKEINKIEKIVEKLKEKESYLIDDNLYSLSVEELNNQIDLYNEEILKIENIRKRKYYNLSTTEITDKIKELTDKLNNTTLNKLNNELKELEEIKRNKYLIGFQLSEKEKIEYNILIEKINILKNKIKIENELNRKSIEELNNELSELDKPTNVIYSLNFGDKKTIKDYNERKEKIKRIKDLIKEKNNNKELEIKELNDELIYRHNNLYLDEHSINEYTNDLNKKIKERKKAIAAKNNKLYLLSTKEINEKIKSLKEMLENNNKLNNETEINLNNKSIEELKEELDRLNKPTNIIYSLSFGDKELEKDYNDKKEKINIIKKEINKKETNKSLNKQLTELINELNNRKELLTLEEKEEITNLLDIKNAYYNIINDAIEKYTNEDINEINEFVSNHELFNIIEKYNNKDKIKKELIDDIINNLKIKEKEEITDNKINKIENNKNKWMKAIAAVTGFATGLGFSCIPGIGTITMGIAISKLAYSGTKATLNFFTKKNPDGRCTKIINTINTKKIELYEKTKEKYPVITEKVNKMRKKIRNFSEKYHMEYFLNGVAVGYLTGNMIDMITGETVLEHAKDLFNNNSGNIAQVTPGNITTESIVESNTSELLSPAPTIDPSTISLEVGDTVDLSSISQGFISSDATESVNMMTNVAKNAVFDKAVELPNGNIRWHFKQLNGKYLGWYDAKEVQEILAKLAETSTKIVR